MIRPALAPYSLAVSTLASLVSVPLSSWSSTAGYVSSGVAGVALIAFLALVLDLRIADDRDPYDRMRALHVSLGARASGDLATYADSVRRARASLGAEGGHAPMLPKSAAPGESK